MRILINYSLKVMFFALFVLVITNVNAQDAKLNLDRLKGLDTKAANVVEVNIDGKMLDLAKRVLFKVNDKDAQKVGEAIKGLKGIYVRVYNFDKENEYDIADIDDIRLQLNTPGWDKIANVRSKKNNQKIDVFTKFSGETMSGIAVILSESKTISVVNVIGPIDLDTLAEMGGNFNIPKIEVEKNTDKPNKPNN